MKLDISRHPCFNKDMHHKTGRIHLPIAPRCNIQCNYCSRDFDCVNESRPGVTSDLLTPLEAIVYLDNMLKKLPNIAVVGIAGPGDPFANPDETMETLRLVREKYPEMLLCVATNGLNVLPYIDELAELELSHLTITINAIDPKIAEKVYSWMRYENRVRNPLEGAEILIANQLEAIKRAKAKGIVVKINSVVVPGINDEHIIDIVKKAKELGADINNCIPLIPTKNTKFADLVSPGSELINKIKDEASEYLPQMRHCARCRADAAGMIGNDATDVIKESMQKAKCMPAEFIQKSLADDRKYIAVTSMEGVLINQHLGEAEEIFIYEPKVGGSNLVDTRKLPERGMSDRWDKVADVLKDCHTLMVNGIGDKPRNVLEDNDINVVVIEGLIDEALTLISKNKSINHLVKRERTKCGTECMGNGTGCG